MIIKLKKFLIYGLKDQIDVFFKAAQEKGFIEFLSKTKKIKKVSSLVKDYISAIKLLKKEPKQLQVDEKISADTLVKKILHLNQSVEKLFEEKRILDSEIMRISPFGDFSKDFVDNLEDEIHRYFQFFTIKKSKREKIKLPEELIYINSAYDLDYFIAINKERKTYSKMIEIFIDTPISTLEQKKIVVEKQIEKTQKEIKHLACHLKYLTKEFIKKLNVYHLDESKEDAFYPLEESVFAIEAWIPKNKIDKLKELTKPLQINYAEVAISKKDRVPTYMENKKNAKVGEDLVNIYDVPSTEDKDPSLWVLIFFAIFFAMIVSDAGYGVIYLIIGLFLKFKLKNPKPMLKRFTKLILILSSACIIWGALTGSFFGVGPSIKTSLGKATFINYLATKKAEYHLEKKDDVYEDWIKKYSDVANAKDGKDFLLKAVKKENSEEQFEALNTFKDNILMETAILIGVLHIALSFLRYLLKNYSGFGWVLFMIGGYLFFPSILNATSMMHFLNILDKETCFFIGKILLFSGIAIAVILAIVQKRLKGIIEITSVISIFADVMSYLRLYALGLAGMIMATTFNDLGVKMGLSIGFIVIIIGQAVNILLTIMSGIIHGLRLNFIEWYHYSFEGDGKLFNPLKLLK
ncbi:MAG: hypothetical protein KR126chlam4_00355 [Candidatus Anoxychlamydiales bacterium]|nr:hypothetical protein [Candidatus Anoxychlamydiales bacterium]NGX40533.1 hypothetical protein [Candidatus Anoxychlamydiales bacterium]